jgi:hypothetical protein
MNFAEAGRLLDGTRPHRSHRTLRMLPSIALVSILTVVLGMIATYVFLYLFWPPIMRLVALLVAHAQPSVRTVSDTFLGISVMVPAPTLPALDVRMALWVACASAVLILLNGILPGRHTPLRSWIGANFILLVLVALYGYFVQSMEYDGAIFMTLVQNTSLVVLLCVPIFAAVMMLLLPFSLPERALMVVLCVVFDAILAAVRIAAFALVVARFGVLAEANLYFFLGPLMDVVYFIAIYSACAVSLSRRLAQSPEVWKWL